MYCHCGKITENFDTGECASCGHARRKAERMKIKEKKPIRRISNKRKKALMTYVIMSDEFLLGRWCMVHGRNCIPTEVHHQKGRVGFTDEYAIEHNIPALIDTRYWIAVCRKAHQKITENSAWAIEEGYSMLRTEKK